MRTCMGHRFWVAAYVYVSGMGRDMGDCLVCMSRLSGLIGCLWVDWRSSTLSGLVDFGLTMHLRHCAML